MDFTIPEEFKMMQSLARQFVEDEIFPLEKEIDPEGRVAYDIVQEIGIPTQEVEAIFCNGRVSNIYDPVFPGDRVALLPYGTPGPYRLFLGMARENLEREKREKQRK